MHRRHLRTAVPLIVLPLVLAGCGVAPTGPADPPAVAPRALALAAVDCNDAEDIGARIGQLEAEGILNRGRATALRTKLVQALRHEAAGRSGHAAEAYAQLVAQVGEWVAGGALDADDVEDLLACAADVLDGPDDPEPDPDPDPEPESPPVIDGIRSAGEWDAATSVAVWAGGTFYYTNDDTHLYVALEMADPDLDAPDGLRIRFDDTQDGIATVGDNEVLLGMDRYFDRHRTMFGWGVDDTQVDGTGAGGSSAGVHFFELAFPLDSGDPNDFALAAGDAVGFCVQYLDNGLRVDEATYPRVGAFDNCMLDADQSSYAVLTTSP